MEISLRAVLCFTLIASCSLSVRGAALDDYIRHYEPLHYDRARLHESHNRVRRSLDDTVVLKFHAYNRPFEVHLEPETNIFSKDHKLRHHNGRLENVDTSHIYRGTVKGEPGSSAHLAIIQGQAQGHISIPGDDTYHIESASRFFRRPSFHSVIYAERHMVLDPYKKMRDDAVAGGSCGLEHVHDWMKQVSESAINPPNRAKRMAPVEEQFAHNKYSERLNRHKRTPLGQKNTCYLYMRSDPKLWDYVKREKYQEPLTDERTKEEIVAFFAGHVSELKKIYQNTVFQTYDGSQVLTGVDFLVQRSTIMTNETERCGWQNQTLYCNPNIDVSNFLNLNSKDNHDEFCLAYVFTYRDFTHGTLGLAWVGSATRAAGGICERYKEYPEGNTRVPKSLNTGIVTIVNYGKTVPTRVSQLTFAHEVGHNFGSPHDSGVECVPTSSPGAQSNGGNYIMYASATMGDKENNDKFSPCSKDNITRVLQAVIAGDFGKFPCFNNSDAAFCGNSIVEKGEDCDCGYSGECQDQCCYAKGSGADKECKLKENKQCSPTQGPCCSKECNYIPLADKTLCRASDDCIMNATCNGTSARCPDSRHQPNMTYCNEFSQVCISGDCQGSVCRRIGWDECFLQSVEGNDGPTREELCYVACKAPSSGTCISSVNTAEVNKPEHALFKSLLTNISQERSPADNQLGVQLPPGSPCDNYKGYCDVFHRCRGVDAEGPLARLKNLIFNPETLQTIRDWIVMHWWAVLLMAIALVVVMGLFIKVCAVHTPSSNPNKAPARKLTLPRRHHANQGAGGQPRGATPKPPGQGSNMPPQRTGYGDKKGGAANRYALDEPRDVVRPYKDSHASRHSQQYDEVYDYPAYMGNMDNYGQRGRASADPRHYRNSAPPVQQPDYDQMEWGAGRNPRDDYRLLDRPGYRYTPPVAPDRNYSRQEPPPPYSGPNVGGPAHGKGPRYNKSGGRDKRGAHSMELQRI